MNSHVQIPRFIIKNFAILATNKNVYVYDFRTKEIHEDGPAIIGTHPDYFDKMAEKYLSDHYEMPLGRIVSKIKKWESNPGSPWYLSEKEEHDIKRFLTELLARSPEILSKAIKNTILEKLPPLQVRSYSVNYVNDEIVKKLFASLKVVVVVFNHSKTSYVSSVKGYSLYADKKYPSRNIHFPITPDIAIGCVTEETMHILFNDNPIVDSQKESVTQFYNESIFTQAQEDYEEIIKCKGLENYYGCVFSNDISELERLSKKFVYL